MYSWANSKRSRRTRKPSVLPSTGLQRVRRDLATEQQRDTLVPALFSNELIPKPKQEIPSFLHPLQDYGTPLHLLKSLPKSELRKPARPQPTSCSLCSENYGIQKCLGSRHSRHKGRGCPSRKLEQLDFLNFKCHLVSHTAFSVLGGDWVRVKSTVGNLPSPSPVWHFAHLC